MIALMQRPQCDSRFSSHENQQKWDEIEDCFNPASHADLH